MSKLAAAFRSLHNGKKLLVLPNAWDPGSARLMEKLGARAVATTSAGMVDASKAVEEVLTRATLYLQAGAEACSFQALPRSWRLGRFLKAQLCLSM
jgi:2-methylisocitrate lyase-like PEP mutase family enzyme